MTVEKKTPFVLSVATDHNFDDTQTEILGKKVFSAEIVSAYKTESQVLVGICAKR